LIVVDTSALMAILLSEPEATNFTACIDSAKAVVVGAPTKFEFLMVASGRLRDPGVESAKNFLKALPIVVREWDSALADHAIAAFTRYGKGQHPAKLNFGDCMSYALARSLNAPLLYKGDDFAKTDIKPAVTASA
jgi:ribonuclease VapC